MILANPAVLQPYKGGHFLESSDLNKTFTCLQMFQRWLLALLLKQKIASNLNHVQEK